MKEYRTKQRERLLSFFKMHPDQQFTIEAVSGYINGISISAVYRNVNQMVLDGSVRRFQLEGSRKFLYQYIGGMDCARHLHLRCTQCGNILHMDDESAEMVIKTVKNNIHFNIDKNKTMIFGSCSSCK